jgi:Panthothenate kinase
MQTISSTPEQLAQEILTQANRGRRFILGIAGAPAAGKSYLANRLVELINQNTGSEIAVVAPMDGFHRTNYELSQMGIWEFKGVPASFTGDAFIEKLEELRDEEKMLAGQHLTGQLKNPHQTALSSPSASNRNCRRQLSPTGL